MVFIDTYYSFVKSFQIFYTMVILFSCFLFFFIYLVFWSFLTTNSDKYLSTLFNLIWLVLNFLIVIFAFMFGIFIFPIFHFDYFSRVPSLLTIVKSTQIARNLNESLMTINKNEMIIVHTNVYHIQRTPNLKSTNTVLVFIWEQV